MTLEPALDAAPTIDPMLGLCVDSYRVRQKIGEGGMGAVYEVEHERLGRRAAAKFLLPRYAQDPTVARRFASEAQLLSRIQHPGLVSVFAIGELQDRTQYFLMDYLRGETLGARLRSRRMPELGAALRLLQQVASTLAVVHAHGVIHRDLKPDNIMLVPDPHVPDGERAVLFDLGVAKVLPGPAADGSPADSAERTRTGVVFGTPVYMAPEQCRATAPVDPQVDVYALGVILFRLCTGRLPFTGEMWELLTKHVTEPPPVPRRINPRLSPELSRLILQMLAKSPAQRPAMAAVAARLTNLAQLQVPVQLQVQAQPVAVAPAAGAQRASEPPELREWLPQAVSVALMALAIATYTHGGDRTSTPPAAPVQSLEECAPPMSRTAPLATQEGQEIKEPKEPNDLKESTDSRDPRDPGPSLPAERQAPPRAVRPPPRAPRREREDDTPREGVRAPELAPRSFVAAASERAPAPTPPAKATMTATSARPPQGLRAEIGAALAASDFAQAVRLADAAAGRSEQEGAWRLIGWKACRQGLEPLARAALPHLEEDGRILVRSECRKQSIVLPP
ncbi:MAG: serine/threonine-protein kinase [Polyangia bacterium]